ncbi:MAG: hypothetical protein ACXVPY_02245 [Bacteroidia bacterium]
MFKRCFILFLFISFAFSACKRETVFTEVKVNNSYSILIPDYLQPCSDLHKDASLQYQNTEKEVYAIVIDEKKITMQDYNLDYDIDTYFKNIVSQGFEDNIKDGKVSIPGREQINGNKALIADVSGKVEQKGVYYKMALVESPYEFYQILIWTKAENKDKIEPDMIKMIESFKELPHPKEELPSPKPANDSLKIVPAW